jgi:hypothetical protein
VRKLSGVFIVILFLVCTLSGRCQTGSGAPVWFTLNAPEGSTVTATGSVTLRFGQVASTCAVIMGTGPCSGVSVGAPSPEAWTATKTFSSASGGTVSVMVAAGSFDNVDPIPGVYKTVQVQEEATAQNITVNGQPVTVPALSNATCQLIANPSSITFPNTTVGYTYATPATIVSNCSTTITITSAQTTGPFSVSGFQTPFSLGAGQTQDYTAIFTPTAVGTAAGNISYVSTATSSRTVTVSLAGNGVSPQPPANHSVNLTWDSGGSQIAGYNVYRSTTTGGPYSRINASTVTPSSYSDDTVASGTTYFYTVTAIGANGAESGYSNQATVTVPTP